MTMHSHQDLRAKRSPCNWLRALWIALVLAGCGGGVDSGGTGGTSSSFASGAIAGFGSVIVNGVRFDDSSASITDDTGASHSRDDLRLGMSTEIHGSAITVDAAGSSTATASSVVFGSEILGPVGSIDLAGSRLVVLGQTVETNANTVFDEASVSGGLPALGVGNLIEVHALFDAATARYTATRIERKSSAVAAYRLRGVVSRLDTAAKVFNIGSERISYAGFNGAAPESLANGSFVRVRLQIAKVAGVWVAVAVTDGMQRPRDGDDVRLEGLINAISSATRFSVNGVAVNADDAGPPATLALGVRVEVQGTASGGVLFARRVKGKTEGDVTGQGFELRGQIASVDAPNLSFVLRGVTVKYSASNTDFRNGSAANLAPAANVEARGVLSADGTGLLATRITFK